LMLFFLTACLVKEVAKFCPVFAHASD